MLYDAQVPHLALPAKLAGPTCKAVDLSHPAAYHLHCQAQHPSDQTAHLCTPAASFTQPIAIHLMALPMLWLAAGAGSPWDQVAIYGPTYSSPA